MEAARLSQSTRCQPRHVMNKHGGRAGPAASLSSGSLLPSWTPTAKGLVGLIWGFCEEVIGTPPD